jgi:hypothetical protein
VGPARAGGRLSRPYTSNPASPFAPDTPCFADTADWDPVGADLSAYAGREVHIRFRFGADAYVVAEGWRVDDVVVSPRTEYEGWLAFGQTNLIIPPGLSNGIPLALDTTPLPPMASGHYALLVHHNDPETPSPIVVPVALHNLTRRVRVTSDGPGAADPAGEFLLEAGEPFRRRFHRRGRRLHRRPPLQFRSPAPADPRRHPGVFLDLPPRQPRSPRRFRPGPR